MDLVQEVRRYGVAELFNSLPKCKDSAYSLEKMRMKDDDGLWNSEREKFDKNEAQMRLFHFIYQDDKSQLVTHSKQLIDAFLEPLDRSIVSKLLHLCCVFDSVDCASVLLGGELGRIPLVNEMNESGKSALHTAAESHATQCVELLLRKRARTDLRTKDGRAQLALELSLSSLRLDLNWNLDGHSVEDLIILLGDKDLSAVRMLCEKTKEVAELACAKAVEGEVVALAALLLFDADKINESVIEFRDTDSGPKEKLTIYEHVVRKVLTLGSATTLLTSAKPSCISDSENTEKRKLLISEIELLQHFGAVAQSCCTDKKVTSPLIRAVQAGDQPIVELLLKTKIDINDVDAEGNSALHWSLKTSRGSSWCEQKMRLLWLLLRNGARVCQKNKLGLTALHIAVNAGNSEALQVLLLEDPDVVNYNTEMKETPLFFAVKNDHFDCAELLLRWGANSEVLNLRRQRPIDLAKSQDMRFMLSPTNITLMNRNFPIQPKLLASLHSHEIFSDNREALLTMKDAETSSYSTKTEICKFFYSRRGCIRGTKCFYSHNEEGLAKQRTDHKHYPAAKYLKRKIFVGGLPSSLDSDSLAKLFEDQFGLVEDAEVIVVQAGNQIQSRGFGFVTFKDERSVFAAVQKHFVSVMDKQVEIKSVIPKCLLMIEDKLSSQENKPEKNCQSQTQAETPTEIIKIGSLEQTSWADKFVQSLPQTCFNESQERISHALKDENRPLWLKIFKKWLPSFLHHLSKDSRDGEYALSSLKGDFMAKFGLKLDHASLGYSKLNDFIKCFSDLCYTKVVPIGRCGPANHVVLVPNSRPNTVRKTYEASNATSSCSTSIDDGHSGGSNDFKCLKDTKLENGVLSCNSLKEVNLSKTCSGENLSPEEILLPSERERFLEFLEEDPKPLPQEEYNASMKGSKDVKGGHAKEVIGKVKRHQQHLVLEALARQRNNPSRYFLREFDFYKAYRENLKVGKCFSCNQRMMLWANFPCKHLLWCTDCKLQVMQVGGLAHKCVLCDMKVDKIDLVKWQESIQLVRECVPRSEQFPPFDPNNYMRSSFLSSPFKKRNMF